jgi:hypothetical protein
MATFRHKRTECQCVDREVNRRIFWLDPGAPGRVYVFWLRRTLPMQRASSAAMASDEGELPGLGDDRINGVTFECDLLVMLEKLLDGGFTDPPKEIAAWWSFNTAANDLARNCSKSEVKKVRHRGSDDEGR